MSITNEDRYNLQTKANDLLGRKEGATLMELLPPVGWADVATKRDLDQLEERVDQRFDGLAPLEQSPFMFAERLVFASVDDVHWFEFVVHDAVAP